MRRRTRSPKGGRGAATTTTSTRGGRGRGRARGGAKGKAGRGGGKTASSNSISGDSNVIGDSVNILAKDNHVHNNHVTSSHFSRAPNGSMGYASGEHVLQLGGIPRRPHVMGPAQQNGNAIHNNNNNNLNNAGNDFYLHKKFKKMTSTVDVTPSTSSSGAATSSGNSTEASSSTNSSSSSGMVYKPKFRIKSDIEAAEAASKDQQQTSSPQPTPMRALSPREKTSPLPATPASDVLPLVTPVVSYGAVKIRTVSDDVSTGNVSGEFRVDHSISPSSSNSSSGTIFVSNKYVMSPVSLASSAASAISPASVESRKLTREMRLDRKSLDDRISKIIDENQSILEWPEQFTKMLKNHTNRGQNSHQRTSHLLSGGSTTEINSSSLSSPTLLTQHHSHPNGLLRHSSTSSIDTPMSGGSVELLATTPHHHSLLNSNGMVHGNSRSLSEPNFKHSMSTDSLHFPISVAGGASSSSVTAPTDLSYGAPISDNDSAMVSSNRGCPSPASSTGSTSSSSTSSSSMVPKKRRRLSPTPSRLCGGEVSELPVNEPSAGGKNYFQDVDMTVRVSNCGPSGAKVTIRTNNGTISGGSVQTAATIGAPVDFSKIITEAVPSPLPLVKPQNGSVFFPSPGPSSPSTIVVQTKPLSLVSNKRSAEHSSVSPGSSILAHSNSEIQKPPKSPRGRPPRKKSVPEATVVSSDCTPAAALSSSLLRVVAPPPEIPSRPKSDDPLVVPKLLPPPPVVTGIPSSTNISLLSVSPHRKLPESMTSFSVSQSEAISSNASATTESETAPSHKSSSPVDKSENANPDKDNPFQVVPNPTQNPKRPTFLALKPVNTNSKKTDPGVLPSPETPRVAKPYNQMTINGQAYTYLGFKVSTRSSYTCLFKTQPMFIQQETDPKMSMYTNWQPRPRDPNQLDIGISTNDSRVNGRKSPHNILYTCAAGKSCDTLTVSSPGQPPISSPMCEQKTFLSGLQSKIAVSSTTSGERNAATSITNRSSSPTANTSSQIPYSQPIKVDVSPIMSSGIVPISPPSNSTSPVTFQASSSSAISKGRLMSIASVSPSGMGISSFSSITEKKIRPPTPPTLSSSDTNSADETGSVFIRRSSLLRSQEDDGESTLSESALTNSKGEGNDDGTLSGSRFDSPRVKIMEGGFESNEDYTYVRGRGRGRYVCEACGIRCKKPSMLRKHLKTHTDLRPYTCKLCNFSFKTKGNLTKHQKSKSHHKKCAGLGIHPESSTSLAMTGPIFSISDTNTTDDNESDDDYDDNGDPDGETDSQDECEGDDSADGNENGSESFEKEIAQSLLDLSKATVRLPSHGSASSDYESSNDARMKSKRPGFPFGTVIEEISNSSVGSFTTGNNTPAPEIPIDLSVKPTIATTSTRQQQQSPPTGYENETKKIKLEKNGLIRSVGVVRKAESWEPAEDEGIRCLNLKRVLNRPSDEETPELPEVKTEVVESCPVASSSETSRVLFGPRQRTESETSSCSAISNLAHSFPTVPPSNEVPVQEQDKNVGTIAASLPQPAGSSSATSAVKLHQPWLSPSEPNDKKDAAEVPAITITPLNVSPESSCSTKRSKLLEETNEIVQRETTTTNITLVNALPAGSSAPSGIVEGGLGGVSSPNSKLFTGLSSMKPQAEFRQPSGAQALVKDEGKAECNVCGKTFSRASQLTLHMNIHYIERPFRCDPCGVSFRTKGHLIKHRRSSSHDCKVYLTEAWGVANEENPRPFKCPDCKIAFRIHGHLAKHLRSKMHIMRMECLGKLPFGIYFEMEKSGINLNEIDTTDCDMSLVSLQNVAKKIYGDQWRERLTLPVEEPAA